MSSLEKRKEGMGPGEYEQKAVEAGLLCRFGVVDLIAEDGPFLCFVEVKLR